MSNKRVYFDNNGTTPLHPEVKQVIIDTLDLYGNPSSVHSFGREARNLIENSRARVASFIGASAEEIVFVGSGSEANNTVLNNLTCGAGFCSRLGNPGSSIVTTKIEHPCILETAKCIHGKGIDVKYLDVDQYGKIKLDQLEQFLKEGVGLVSVMMANNEIGTIQDIKAISALCRKYNSLIHTDAAQAVGKIPVNVQDLDVDFLTMSGHKVYGPKGIGALYVRKSIPFCPLITGGHQEQGRRAGTENSIGIIALGKAIELRAKEMDEEEARLLKIKEYMKEEILKRVPDVSVNGHPTDCLPGTLNVSFDGAEGEAILLYLDMEGIAISTGSACASGSLDPSHVLLATGVNAEKAHGSIRISLGRTNTKDEADYFLEAIERTIKRIRMMSTVYVEKK